MKRLFYTLISLLLLSAVIIGAGQLAYADSSAPIAENLELTTYRNVTVGGKLSAYDPDGGEIKFIISTEPIKGRVELEEDGSFVYTPEAGKKGRDYFGYKVSDSEGNISQESTVIIRIEKQSRDVFYSDMQGSADEYTALLLSEKGIFTGEQIGENYCFYPEKEVSRGEFLSLCMLLKGGNRVDAVLNTGYADDAKIPTWMKPYAANAAMSGVYTGIDAEEGSVFSHDDAITMSEAILMLDRALNTTRVNYLALDEYAPEDIAQACINLAACGVLEDSGISPDILTRKEMARMISSAISVMEKR